MSDQNIRLLLGDCFEVLKGLEPGSIGAVVCDPPYGLEFMGKEWDAPWKYGMSDPGYTDGGNRLAAPSFTSSRNPTCRNCGRRQRTWKDGPDACSCGVGDFDERENQINDRQRLMNWHRQWLEEAFRVLVPGGLIKVFSGTRTKHRLEMAVEAAGFVLLGEAAWMQGQGFPKSLDLSKAVDKMMGAAREAVGRNPNFRPNKEAHNNNIMRPMSFGEAEVISLPTTPEATLFEGWGTALKPGWEPFVLGQKPFMLEQKKEHLC